MACCLRRSQFRLLPTRTLLRLADKGKPGVSASGRQPGLLSVDRTVCLSRSNRSSRARVQKEFERTHHRDGNGSVMSTITANDGRDAAQK